MKEQEIAKQCISAYDLDNQNLWLAPMSDGGCRLIDYYWPEKDPLVQLVEIYDDNNGGQQHARIYLHPQETHVNTVLVGSWDTLDKNPFFENLPNVPLTDPILIKAFKELGIDDVVSLLSYWEVFSTIKNPHGLIRLTSRVLTEVRGITINGIKMQLNFYQNQIKRDENLFFILATPIDRKESGQRLLITNDPEYRDNQHRLKWSKVEK